MIKSTYAELKAGQVFAFNNNDVMNTYVKVADGYKRAHLSRINPDTLGHTVVYIKQS